MRTKAECRGVTIAVGTATGTAETETGRQAESLTRESYHVAPPLRTLDRLAGLAGLAGTMAAQCCVSGGFARRCPGPRHKESAVGAATLRSRARLSARDADAFPLPPPCAWISG